MAIPENQQGLEKPNSVLLRTYFYRIATDILL